MGGEGVEEAAPALPPTDAVEEVEETEAHDVDAELTGAEAGHEHEGADVEGGVPGVHGVDEL